MRKGYQVFTSATRPPVHTYVYFYVDMLVRFLQSDISPSRDRVVLVAHDTPKIPEKCIFYNSEQLTRRNQLLPLLQFLNHPNIEEVWDYSVENIKILKQHGIPAKHVPLRIPPTYKAKLENWLTQPKRYEVGFCGSLTPRRRAAIRRLKDANINVHLVHTTGEKRDEELAQCKIMLNWHAGPDYQVFESVRCEPWLCSNVPVVSEPSLDDDPRCIITTGENLVATVQGLLR